MIISQDSIQSANTPLLKVKNLRTYFDIDEGTLKAVDGVSFSIRMDESLGLIGESGCGKSVTALSVMRLVSSPGRLAGGEILLQQGRTLLDLAKMDPSGREIRDIRGSDIAMVFQEPMTSLSPVHTIGNQIREAVFLHRTSDKGEAQEIALDMLDRVGIANPSQRVDAYPHQLSGGMRQRAMIAMALSCLPKLLIADEPTTALDVTVQAQILDLIKELQEQFGMAVLYITHDLGVIAEVCHRVAVMYLGKIVEIAASETIYAQPLHPYTQALLSASPMPDPAHRRKRIILKGDVPSPIDPPPGCRFHTRCPFAEAICAEKEPALREINPGHQAACHFAGQVGL